MTSEDKVEYRAHWQGETIWRTLEGDPSEVITVSLKHDDKASIRVTGSGASNVTCEISREPGSMLSADLSVTKKTDGDTTTCSAPVR